MFDVENEYIEKNEILEGAVEEMVIKLGEVEDESEEEEECMMDDDKQQHFNTQTVNTFNIYTLSCMYTGLC